jgi:hypothetical protein
MLNLLNKIPFESHAKVIGTMQGVAYFAALMGFLSVMAFSEATEEQCTGALLWKDCVDVAVPTSERLTYLVVGLGLLLLAVVCVVGSLRLMGMRARLKKYAAILTGIESMTVMQLAGIVGSSLNQARDEVQLMIDSDMLDDVYVDYSRDVVVSKKYIPKSSQKTVVVCRRCQAHNELIVGITKSCQYCREPLLLN